MGELSIRSAEFRARWAAHNVTRYAAGMQRFHDAEVGDLDLDYNAFGLVAEPGLTLITYTAAAGAPAPRRPRSPCRRSALTAANEQVRR